MGVILLFNGIVVAQSDLSEERFQDQSLQLRTALHYDSLVESPLDALVRLYQNAGRSDELISLYQVHIAQFPDDVGAKVVLVRVLRLLEQPGVEQQLATAVQLYPDFAPIHYVLYQFLDENSDPRSLEALSRAIDLQTNPARRSEWLDELLERSKEGGRELATAQLQKLIDEDGQTPESLLVLAQLMQRYQFWELSLSALSKAKEGALDPESGLEAEVLSAKSEAELGNRQAAGRRLDAVLARLSPDHWRRSEVMSQRVSVLASKAEREAMLKTVRDKFQKNPQDVSAILDMAEMLIANEKRGDAADLLADSSIELPKSELLEAKAIKELRAHADYQRFEQYLEERLEVNPDRGDLRLELVKVRYALGKDLDATQDLRAVLAGQDSEESSGLILETARFLQALGKLQPAAGLLKSFVEKNPGRLDVVRELAEVYLSLDDHVSTTDLFAGLDVENANVENLIDLVGFLVENDFLVDANRILTARLKINPELFEAGLLHIRVLGEIGDADAASDRIDQVRRLADTTPRYSQWLEAALESTALFEREDQFFDSEQARFAYSGEDWTPKRIDRFLALCELAGRRRMSERVSNAIQSQLAVKGISTALKIRLRQLLVSSMEEDSDKVGEVEDQLELLAVEDPERAANYELQLALVYDRAGRLDLAGKILGVLDFSKVTSIELLRDAVEPILEFGFAGKAIDVLAAITALEPRDVFSWERRLSLLVREGDEKEFRAVVRSLLEDVDSLNLRESTRKALSRHLLDSYWRSVASVLSNGESDQVESVLPLLDAVDREATGGQDHLWSKWTRAYVMASTGRVDQAQVFIAELKKMNVKGDPVVFPDGLALSPTAVAGLVTDSVVRPLSPLISGAESLLQAPEMAWAFEVDPGTEILRSRAAGESIVVLDDRGQFYRVDAASGKLMWKENPGVPGEEMPEVSFQNPGIVTELKPVGKVKLVRDFLTDGELFFTAVENGIGAYTVDNCEMVWRTALRKSTSGSVYTPPVGAWPETRLALSGNLLVVFEPRRNQVSGFDSVSGKLQWNRELEEPDDEPILFSLNSGLSVSEGKIFVYGLSTAVLDLKTGNDLWTFRESAANAFPITIREDKNLSEESEVQLVSTTLSDGDEDADWKRGNSGEAVTPDVKLIDYLNSRAGSHGGLEAVDPDRSMRFVAPAVYWAQQRLRAGIPAMGELSDGFLWLMEDGGIRRVSLRLPLASSRLPAEGVFLGSTGNHAWFISKGKLVHVDFLQGETFSHPLATLGAPEGLRGAVAGTRVVVRGTKGVRVLNSFSGRQIAEWPWPKELFDYLEQRDLMNENSNTDLSRIWQGNIRSGGPGQPSFCYSSEDIVGRGIYVTGFGGNSLVAFGRPSAETVAVESLPASPATPDPGEQNVQPGAQQ